MTEVKVTLANPRGFCAGVDRAIAIVNRALELFDAPIYVRHEVVHNRSVVEDLRQRGAVFVDELDQVPPGSTLIFSAHGVSQQVRQLADERQLKVFDATCPLVTKVHMEVARYSRRGQDCILIGHQGHPEVEGTLGQFDPNYGATIYLVESIDQVASLQVKQPDNLAYVTQTTLSIDDTADIIAALRQRFPAIVGPAKEDICYATQNRQNAVKRLAPMTQLMLVVGSPNSSNSNRLRELAERLGTEAYLIDSPEQIQPAWLKDKKHIGVTAGASAPESLVQAVVNRLSSLGATTLEDSSGEPENVTFAMPKALRIVS